MANSENLDLKRLDEPKSSTNFNHQIYYQNNFDKIDAAVGAKPADLTTTAKTIIPAINELFNSKVNRNYKVNPYLPTLENGYAIALDRLYVYQSDDDIVHVVGGVKHTNLVRGTTIFTLPANLSPLKILVFCGSVNDVNDLVVYVYPDGKVNLIKGNGAVSNLTWASLSMINFKAGM